jgi:hypothetical protein
MTTPSKLLNADGSPVDPVQARLPSMEETASGLAVPKGTVKKKRVVIPNADWKMWRRSVRNAGEVYKLRTLLACIECGDIAQAHTTEKMLECKCTKFILPGWEGVVDEEGVPQVSPTK